MSTLTQISNLFNLMVQQPNSGLNFYHFGWRSDINRNIDNNFDQSVETGRLYPALQFHVPEYTEPVDKLQFEGYKEKIQCTLWFDKLQDYENDGSLDTDNLIEQWQELKKIADVFIINFNQLYSNYYQAGYLEDNIRFIPRSNLHNDRLVTWEVNFDLVHFADCVDILDQIDTSQFPATFEEISIIDIENYDATTPPTRCDLILQQLSNDDLLNCILPTYDFSNTETQNATTAQQQTDLSEWLCGPSGVNSSMEFDGVNEYVQGVNYGNYSFERTSAFTFSMWVKMTGGSIFPLLSKWFPFQGYMIRLFSDGRIVVTMDTGAPLAGRRISIVSNVGDFPFNEWAHFTFSYDGSLFASGIKSYTNANEFSYNPSPQDNLTAPFTMQNTRTVKIGAEPTIGQFGEGFVYDFKIWNVVLTPSEITQQYNYDLTDISNNKILSNTVQPSALFDWQTFGKNAGFGTTSWCLSNMSDSTSVGFDSINMERNDRNEIERP